MNREKMLNKEIINKFKDDQAFLKLENSKLWESVFRLRNKLKQKQEVNELRQVCLKIDNLIQENNSTLSNLHLLQEFINKCELVVFISSEGKPINFIHDRYWDGKYYCLDESQTFNNLDDLISALNVEASFDNHVPDFEDIEHVIYSYNLEFDRDWDLTDQIELYRYFSNKE